MRTTWTFHSAGQLHFGPGATRHLAEIAVGLDVKRLLLVTDQVSAQFDRFMALEQATANLRSYGIEPTWYKDTPSTGTDQGFAAETASAIDDFPDVAQVALFPEGTFLHLDGGVLELGIVRDSTLNSTNDYQVFGETFENVARIGPTQAARWASVTICPTGSFPAAGTAISC